MTTASKSFNFYPATAGMLAAVLDEAWQELVDRRDPRVLDQSLTREHIASRIRLSALLGERNPSRLKSDALSKSA
ncbi:MAG: hypothetical protein M3N38_10495 [Pseudomonadota bacterium]|nr:hypothetical protein [Pseudomonadota bacterium]